MAAAVAAGERVERGAAGAQHGVGGRRVAQVAGGHGAQLLEGGNRAVWVPLFAWLRGADGAPLPRLQRCLGVGSDVRANRCPTP